MALDTAAPGRDLRDLSNPTPPKRFDRHATTAAIPWPGGRACPHRHRAASPEPTFDVSRDSSNRLQRGAVDPNPPERGRRSEACGERRDRCDVLRPLAVSRGSTEPDNGPADEPGALRTLPARGHRR